MRLRNTSTLIPAAILSALLALPAPAQPTAPARDHDPTAEDTTTTSAQSPAPPDTHMTPEELALIDRYLTNVRAEPVGKIDTRTATTGQRITLQVAQDATLANGTSLPRGTNLTGRILRAQPWQKDGPAALLSIAIDRAVLRDGSSIPIRCVLRTIATTGLNSGSTIADASQPGSRPRRGNAGGASVGGPVGGSIPLGNPTPMGSGPVGADSAGNGSPGTTTNPNSTPTSPTATGSNPNSVPIGDPGIGGAGSTRAALGNATAIATSADPEQPVASAGENIHDAPRRTGLPGVLLSGASIVGTSGILSAFERNITLDATTQLTLGIITR